MQNLKNTGQNLEVLLRERREPLSIQEALLLTKEVLSAVEEFHGRGRLHLAVCPENIWILPGRAVLRMPEEDYSPERQWYFAPEVRLRNYGEASRASDLYSVCAVLFYLVMGLPLGDEEVVGSRLSRYFLDPEAALPGLPRIAAAGIGRILLKGLHTLPQRRYQNAAELRRDLEELQKGVLLYPFPVEACAASIR